VTSGQKGATASVLREACRISTIAPAPYTNKESPLQFTNPVNRMAAQAHPLNSSGGRKPARTGCAKTSNIASADDKERRNGYNNHQRGARSPVSGVRVSGSRKRRWGINEPQPSLPEPRWGGPAVAQKRARREAQLAESASVKVGRKKCCVLVKLLSDKRAPTKQQHSFLPLFSPIYPAKNSITKYEK